MSITKWQFLRFAHPSDDGNVTKAHVAPNGLVPALLRDLAARNCNTECTRETITRTSMDQPGMVHTGRPWEDFRLNGLEFSLPCEDITDFYYRLNKLAVRRFDSGQEYFKLHSWCICIVLRPVHKVALELQLDKRRAQAEAEALAFYADKLPSGQILREACAKVNNLPVERVPALDSDRQPNDRFFIKERGQA